MVLEEAAFVCRFSSVEKLPKKLKWCALSLLDSFFGGWCNFFQVDPWKNVASFRAAMGTKYWEKLKWLFIWYPKNFVFLLNPFGATMFVWQAKVPFFIAVKKKKGSASLLLSSVKLLMLGTNSEATADSVIQRKPWGRGPWSQWFFCRRQNGRIIQDVSP